MHFIYAAGFLYLLIYYYLFNVFMHITYIFMHIVYIIVIGILFLHSAVDLGLLHRLLLPLLLKAQDTLRW